jgi:hypothetical protein
MPKPGRPLLQLVELSAQSHVIAEQVAVTKDGNVECVEDPIISSTLYSEKRHLVSEILSSVSNWSMKGRRPALE